MGKQILYILQIFVMQEICEDFMALFISGSGNIMRFPMLAPLFLRNTSVFHFTWASSRKIPLGIRLLTSQKRRIRKGSGNTVFGAGDGACSDDRYG